MPIRAVFLIQLAWFFVAWGLVCWVFVAPRLAELDRRERLAVWITPHLFRVMGLGLLVDGLAPGLSSSFSIPTAAADATTAILTAITLVALKTRKRWAFKAAWLQTLVGTTDALLALPHAASVQAAEHLTVQWYVPVLAGPLMVICHVMVIRTLLARDEVPPAAGPRRHGLANERSRA